MAARKPVTKLLRQPLAAAALLFLVLVSLVALLAPVLGLPDFAEISRNRLQPPGAEHLLGTDHIGRDIASRIAHGARASLYVGFLSVALGGLVGINLGLLSGFFGGWVDETIMRLMDVLLVFPALLLALIVVTVLGPGLTTTSLAIALVFVPAFARITRGSVLAVRERDFVEAGRALGAGHAYLMFRHVLPNSLAPVIVQLSISLAYAILIEAALSFLGYGTQPPTPSWGQMLNEARNHMGRAPWFAIFPGAAIAFTVGAFNLLGDRIRDLLDPRL